MGDDSLHVVRVTHREVDRDRRPGTGWPRRSATGRQIQPAHECQPLGGRRRLADGGPIPLLLRTDVPSPAQSVNPTSKSRRPARTKRRLTGRQGRGVHGGSSPHV
jgi:hypothetical protein